MIKILKRNPNSSTRITYQIMFISMLGLLLAAAAALALKTVADAQKTLVPEPIRVKAK